MTPPAATVVIPAYRAAGLIETGLRSLLAQHGVPQGFEVVVVDDASDDATVARVEALAGEAAAAGVRLRVLRQPRNRGPAAARNRGVEAAAGDVVLFTDADCEAAPDWVAEMLRPFADATVAAVKGAYRTRQTALAARFAQAEFDERYRRLARRATVDVVFTYAAAFRRDVFRACGGFDTGFPVADNEDTDLSYRIVAAGHRAVFNPKAIVYHRHPDTLARYLKKKVSRGYWRMLVYRRFPDKAVADSYTPQTLKLQILLGLAAPAATATALVAAAAWPLAGVVWVAALLTTLPAAWPLVGRDTVLAAASPGLQLARSLALGIGSLSALAAMLVGDPLAPRQSRAEAPGSHG